MKALWRFLRSLFSAPAAPVQPEPTGTGDAAAVCIGLTAVDPRQNQGWDGECPGCDLDCGRMAALFTSRAAGKTSTTTLFNETATWAGVQQTIRAQAATLKRGGLLFLTFSGHGGQKRDQNGDEQDGMDETICLWDGQIRDDDMLKLIHSLPRGLRIVLVSDQCHSEGNFRGMPPPGIRLFRRRPRADGAAPWDGALIQLACCREDSYSYGDEGGGRGTNALLAAVRRTLTWREWFNVLAQRLGPDQPPAWVEYGAVTDEFRNGVVFK